MKTSAIAAVICASVTLVGACASDPSQPSGNMQIDETCSDYGCAYQVTLPNNPSPEVSAACDGMVAEITSCGYTSAVDTSACDRYAATEPADRASNYDCVTQLPCSSLSDANALQGCDPPASTFGDDFCASLASSCPSSGCSSDVQSSLDSDGAWVRSDALDAAMTCLSQPSCDETTACISAWRLAVE